MKGPFELLFGDTRVDKAIADENSPQGKQAVTFRATQALSRRQAKNLTPDQRKEYERIKSNYRAVEKAGKAYAKAKFDRAEKDFQRFLDTL